MTRAYDKSEAATLENLGNIAIDRDVDATRVRGSNGKMLALLDTMLTLYPKGIHLVRDHSGFLRHRGRATSNEVLLSRRSQTPVVFVVDKRLQSRRP